MNDIGVAGGTDSRQNPLTARQVALIRASWLRVQPIADLAAALFYRRLFELNPRLAALFPQDTTEQGRKLMATLGVVVARLDRLGDVVPAVEQLGRRHVAYGVEDAHYDIVGSALLDTLRVALGDDLGPEAEAAWGAAYGTLAAVMQRAASDTRSLTTVLV
jgi:nitric oxide dioxygenase